MIYNLLSKKLNNFIVKLFSLLMMRFGNFGSCHAGTLARAKEDLVIPHTYNKSYSKLIILKKYNKGANYPGIG